MCKDQAPNPKKVGNIFDLLSILSITDQFLSGVFIAVKEGAQISNTIELGTEDTKFRPIEMEGVVIEIRAFDTSYFEVYTEDLSLMQKISTHFQTKLMSQSEYYLDE